MLSKVQIKKKMFQNLKLQVVSHIMDILYSNLDETQKARIQATLLENFSKFSEKEVLDFLKKRFLDFESQIQSIDVTEKGISGTRDQKLTPVYFCSTPDAEFDPHCAYNSPGIDLPLQEDLHLYPGQKEIVDTKFKFFIPSDYYGQIAARSSTTKVNITVFPGVIDNDYSGYIKLVIRNISHEELKFEKGVSLAQLLIKPVLHPALKKVDSIDITSNRGTGSFGSSSKCPNEPNTSNMIAVLPNMSPILPNMAPISPNMVSSPNEIDESCNFSVQTEPVSRKLELALYEIKTCILHELIANFQPDEIILQCIKTKLLLPRDKHLKNEIWQSLKSLECDIYNLQFNSAHICTGNPDEVNSNHITAMPNELMENLHIIKPVLDRSE